MTVISETPFFIPTPDGVSLYGITSLAQEPVAEVVLVHGLAEHSGRYRELINAFYTMDITVHTLDLRGHGKSGGSRAYINSFDEYITDVNTLINYLGPANHPRFLMGHSMGSLVGLTWLTRQTKPPIQGFISSSGALKVSDSISPFLRSISHWLSKAVPALPTIRLDASAIARDKLVVEAYNQDRLVWRKGIKARLGHELIQAAQALHSQFENITLPLLVFHGDADRLADVTGSQALFEKCRSSDKELWLSEGGYHELLNDFGKEELVGKIIQWIKSRS